MNEKSRRSQAAWTCLMTNLLVLPGLGTLMGGRRIAGLLQALISVVGFVLTAVWLWSYGTTLLDSGLPEGLGPGGNEGVLGLALFAVSWFWSLASGLALLRDSDGHS